MLCSSCTCQFHASPLHQSQSPDMLCIDHFATSIIVNL
jgi:hypothetical protein